MEAPGEDAGEAVGAADEAGVALGKVSADVPGLEVSFPGALPD